MARNSIPSHLSSQSANPSGWTGRAPGLMVAWQQRHMGPLYHCRERAI